MSLELVPDMLSQGPGLGEHLCISQLQTASQECEGPTHQIGVIIQHSSEKPALDKSTYTCVIY